MTRTALLLVVTAVLCPGQWLDYKESGVPRLRDGSVNLSAPVPKGPGGKPDLSGVWVSIPTPRPELEKLFGPEAFILDVPGDSLESFSKYAINALADYPMDAAPMTAEGAAILERHLKTWSGDNPTAYCLPAGLPVGQLLFLPFKIGHTAREVVVLMEGDNTFRQIYLDGRPLPEDPNPSWLGYSTAHWEGNTLAVDTAGFNGRSWLDLMGHPRSEAMKIAERYTRRDYGHMDVEFRFEDPRYYTHPFSYKIAMKLLPDTDVLETVCAENEKDARRLNP